MLPWKQKAITGILPMKNNYIQRALDKLKLIGKIHFVEKEEKY